LGSKCLPCSYDCLTCSRTGVCDSCSRDKDFRQLDNVTLRCMPIIGYYDINQTVCVRCPPSCLSCISASYCIQCQSGYYFFNNTCSSGCPKRFFIEKSSLTCQSCPLDCFYCDSINNCLDCSLAGDFRMPTSDSKRCASIVGYYDDNSPVCKPCQNNCSICPSLTFCITCLKGYFLNLQNQCGASCPARMYPDTLSGTCYFCPYDCYTCDSSGNCLTCN